MRLAQYWHSVMSVDAAYGVCRVRMHRDFAMFIQEFLEMAIKGLSVEEKADLTAAIDLAVASCERRASRKGESVTIVAELKKQADKYRGLRAQVVAS